MALDTSHWTWINHFFIWGSIVFYVIFTFAIYSTALFNISPANVPSVGAAMNTFGSGAFWASLFLTVVLCIFPVIGYRWTIQKMYPTMADKIRKGVWKARRSKNSSLVSAFYTNVSLFSLVDREHCLVSRDSK